VRNVVRTKNKAMTLLHTTILILGLFTSCNLSQDQSNPPSSTSIETTISEEVKTTIEKTASSIEGSVAAMDESVTSIEDKTELLKDAPAKMEEKAKEMMSDAKEDVKEASADAVAKYESSAVQTKTQMAKAQGDIEENIPSTTSSANDVSGQVAKPIEKETPTSTIISQTEAVQNTVQEPEKVIEKPVVKETVKTKTAVAEGHAAWNGLLSKYVSSTGNVDYGSFKKNEAQLDSYLSWLSANAPSKTDKSQKAKAYWINAYNAYTVKLIVDNYPVSSITDLHGGKPWDVSWIKLGGSTYSLNNIEHDILRPIWKDARIHFAVNCAAKSCPPIANKAYTVGNMNALLDSSTKKFINNSSYNSVSSSSLTLSKIFDWYKEDFGDLITYINKYSSVDVGSGASISFKDYNWSLNGK